MKVMCGVPGAECPKGRSICCVNCEDKETCELVCDALRIYPKCVWIEVVPDDEVGDSDGSGKTV